MEKAYYDIHAHILPGVDDGPTSMEETEEMLKTALDQGIKTIIATPHYVPGGDNLSVEQLELIRSQVQEKAVELDKDLTILLGNELFYSDSIVEELKQEKALTLAGSRYVLVEFSVNVKYDVIYRGMGELVRAGYAPVLAHVERYRCLFKRENLVIELINSGCYIQINTGSLIGGFFNSEANLNRKLFLRGLVHFTGSDCHSNTMRPPIMIDAVNALLRKCDAELIHTVFQENPQYILKNIYI